MTTITPSSVEAPLRGPRAATAAARGQRSGRKRRWWLFGGPLLIVVGVGGYWRLGARPGESGAVIETHIVARRSFPITLNEKGELEAKNSEDVKCEVEGRSTIISLIEEGAEVKKGDVLVKLASAEIEERVRSERIKLKNAEAQAQAAVKELEILKDQNESDIRKAELAVSDAETDLNKYLEGDFVQKKSANDLAVNRAAKLLAQAKLILDDSVILKEKGFVTQREYEQDELTYYERQCEVDKSELEQRIYMEYTHPQELGKKQSTLEEARKELDRTRARAAAKFEQQKTGTEAKQEEFTLTQERLNKLVEQQAKTEIKAPADGLVVYDPGNRRWGGDSTITEGAEVFERQTIVMLPDTSLMQVKLRIHESKSNKIKVDQSAVVEIDGLPGVSLKGKVTRIAPLADTRNRWLNPDLKEYDTTVELDQNDVALKPGMTARALIFVGYLENVVAVPVQAVYSSGPRSFVFRGRSPRSAEPVEVKLGSSSDEYVEITSGLQEGDVILLAAPDALVAELPAPQSQAERAAAPPDQRKAGAAPAADAQTIPATQPAPASQPAAPDTPTTAPAGAGAGEGEGEVDGEGASTGEG